MSLQLVCFDTDRIKEYLFATSVLSDIREASALLDHLNRELIPADIKSVHPGFAQDDLVYAAGGSAVAILPDEETARQAVRKVEQSYRTATVTASITGVCLPISREDLEHRFGERVRQAGFLLRQRKAEKGGAPTLPPAPYMRLCDACGCFPAAEQDKKRGELVCRSCWNKRRQARSQPGQSRKTLWNRLVQVIESHPTAGEWPAGWDDLLASTVGNSDYRLHSSPDDFSSIASTSSRPGYIALIYADGNNMGRAFELMQTPAEYHALASWVDDLLLRVTYASLMKEVRKRPGRPVFELLMAGGDDLMLVCAADCALPVAVDLVEGFEKYSAPLLESIYRRCSSNPPLSRKGKGSRMDSLSLSVGAVIAREDLPIAVLREVAASLQGLAKRRSFEAGGKGAIDFMVVTSAGTRGVEWLREELLTEKGFAFRPESGNYRLTWRPYLAADLRWLIENARALEASGLSPSQLHRMFAALFQSPPHASLVALETLGRLRKKPRAKLSEFLDGAGCNSPFPWRTQSGWQDTPLLDLVEIYPFV